MKKATRSMEVSVVIPNWNGRHLLEKNLPSVLDAAKFKKNNILEIIVVDDGSQDASVEYIKKTFRNSVRLVQHAKNRGFAYAVNAGVKAAKGDLVCLLNTDVIPNKDFLSSTLSHFNDQKVFAVNLHESGFGPASAQFTNGYFAHRGTRESSRLTISMWASGGSAVFNRALWWELHGLDEELFSPFYWEDVDIGYRAWKHGYKVLWDPKANVTHAHESIINTDNFKKRYMNYIKERNELLFIWKNIHSETHFKRHKSEVLKRALRHPGYFVVLWLAFKKRKLVLARRAREQKESKLSDEAVFATFKP